jgi:hypothetical protein
MLPAGEQIVRSALRQYVQDYAQWRRLYRHATEASIINDLMWHRAVQKFQDHRRIRFASINQLDLAVIDGRYGIRFKMLRPDKRTENIETEQQSLFDSQQLCLPDLPNPLVTLNVGYVPEEVELSLSSIFITRPRAGGAVDWWYELGDSNVTELPLHQAEPQERQVQPRARRAAHTGRE